MRKPKMTRWCLYRDKLPLFSNVEDSGAISERRWSTRPNTLLIDSQQLESGESLSAEFKAAAQREIGRIQR